MRFIPLFLLILVTGCGFKPIYAKTSKGDDKRIVKELSSIEVSDIPERSGQELKTALEDLLNPTAQDSEVKYRLDVKIDRQITSVGVETNLRITRYNIILTANYNLVNITTGKLEKKDRMRISASYSASNSQFANFSAERDAESRAVQELSRSIKFRLVSFFEGKKKDNENNGKQG